VRKSAHGCCWKAALHIRWFRWYRPDTASRSCRPTRTSRRRGSAQSRWFIARKRSAVGRWWLGTPEDSSRLTLRRLSRSSWPVSGATSRGVPSYPELLGCHARSIPPSNCSRSASGRSRPKLPKARIRRSIAAPPRTACAISPPLPACIGWRSRAGSARAKRRRYCAAFSCCGARVLTPTY
jgi:hypothetical protein